jgi:hypothetical protein
MVTKQKRVVNVSIWIMLSLLASSKVIALTGLNCIRPCYHLQSTHACHILRCDLEVLKFGGYQTFFAGDP